LGKTCGWIPSLVTTFQTTTQSDLEWRLLVARLLAKL
jgi:hypothetical protein